MATTSSTPISSSSSSDHFTPTEWTQRTMLSDVMQQKGLLIGGGVGVLLFLFLLTRRGPAPEQRAARRLVRDWRKVGNAADVVDLLGANLPAIIRPVLIMALHELERQLRKGFQSLERDIERL